MGGNVPPPPRGLGFTTNRFAQNHLSMVVEMVPLKGGRWHIIHQLAVYTTYILPSGGLYATYHLSGEPETTIESPESRDLNQLAINKHLGGTSNSPSEHVTGYCNELGNKIAYTPEV